MSDPTTTPEPNATPPQQDAAAPTPAEPAPRTRSALAEKLAAELTAKQRGRAGDETPPAPLGNQEPIEAPPVELATPPAQPSAAERHAARVREQVLQRQQERLAREAQRAQATAPAPAPATRQQPTSQALLAEMRRDPRGMAAALRDAGIDVPTFLHELTNDTLAPGSARAVALAEDQAAEARRANARLDELLQQREAERQQGEVAREQAAFAHHAEAKEGEDALYPMLSRLDPWDRVRIGQLVFEEMAARGMPYDREAVAVEAEAHLTRLARSMGHVPPSSGSAQASPPAPQAQPPASTPAAPKSPAAKARRSPAALAAQSAPPQPPLTHAQRRERLIADLEAKRARS